MNLETIYIVYLSAFLIALISTYPLYHALLSCRIIDLPNSRSLHSLPRPRAGGIAILIAFFSTLIASGLADVLDSNFSQALIYGGITIALIGLGDDIYNLNPIVRFLATLLVTILCVLGIGMPSVSFMGFVLQPSVILLVFEVLAILWILNLFNFMDGIDAIASVEAISVILLASALLLFVEPTSASSNYQVEVLLLIAFSTAGFLVWNWPPAKLFMGDVGSGFLGFVLALFAVQTSIEQTLNVWVWLILLGVFFSDATVTVIRRIFNKKKFYEAHREHVYQHLVLYIQEHKDLAPEALRTYAHKITSTLVVVINFVWLAPWAYMAKIYSEQAMLFALVALTPLLILFILAPHKFPLRKLNNK